MTNKQIYEIAEKLGLVAETAGEAIDPNLPIMRTQSDIFRDVTSKDLISVMNFVDELFLNNDVETLKKFLTVIIYNNK